MELRNLIDYDQLSEKDFDELCLLANDMMKNPKRYSSACSGKILATLFYEPSTRTQMSFQTAMLRLGGSVIGFSDPNASSVKKGESLRDTIKIVTSYADVAVIRNPYEGAAYAASLYSRVPVINAGDGGHLHPTQTMTDLLTIRNLKGSCDNLNIGFCGDLLYGRTVHSLISALLRHKGIRLWLVSTPELGIPDYLRELLDKNGMEYHEVRTLEECIADLDVLYMTRIQQERFASREEYEKQSGIYVLDEKKMLSAKSDMIILHPLPKIDEITYGVDDDPRAKYFEQAQNGLYIRMALILTMCENNPSKTYHGVYEKPIEHFCKNPNCITHTEKYLPPMTKTEDATVRCAYCDHIQK